MKILLIMAMMTFSACGKFKAETSGPITSQAGQAAACTELKSQIGRTVDERVAQLNSSCSTDEDCASEPRTINCMPDSCASVILNRASVEAYREFLSKTLEPSSACKEYVKSNCHGGLAVGCAAPFTACRDQKCVAR